MAGFDILLNYMRTISNNKSDQGFRFEQLIKKYCLQVHCIVKYMKRSGHGMNFRIMKISMIMV